MNIEDTELDERHAEIKFLNNSQYVLSDLDSQGGTWVRVNKVLLAKFHCNFAVDLYSEDRKRVFKVQNHQFIINNDPSNECVDEVPLWLKLNGFEQFIPVAESRNCKTLKELTQNVK